MSDAKAANPLEIKSIEDLTEDKAKEIALRYKLTPDEILPRYLELAAEVQANGGTIEVDITDKDTPLDAHNLYIRKLVCGAVISYELSNQPALKFPVPGEIAGVFEEVLLITMEIKGVITRTMPVQLYKQIGDYYCSAIKKLESHRDASLSAL